MSWLFKRPETKIEKENFLSIAEKYVAENGTEALEKLIASELDLLQSKGSRTDIGVEEIKAVAEADANEMTSALKVQCTDPVLVEEKKSFTEVVKKMTVPAATGETLLPEKAPLKKVQKEWTCGLCQVKTSSEANLISHLGSMKHRAKCEKLKAAKATQWMAKNKSVQSNQDSKNSICEDELSQNKVEKQEEKVKVPTKSEPEPYNQNTKNSSISGMNNAKKCQYCDETCTCKIDDKSHRRRKRRRRHLSRIQELAGTSASVQG